jgi:single-stranded DNA-binding protein
MSSSTESERRSNMSATQRTLTFKLDANLGSDPVLRSTREQVYTQSRDAEAQPLTRWHRRIDWQGLTAAYRKGDRVCLSGFFRVRKHQQDGEERQLPEIVLTGARLESINVHVEALIDEAVEQQSHKLAHQFRTHSLRATPGTPRPNP